MKILCIVLFFLGPSNVFSQVCLTSKPVISPFSQDGGIVRITDKKITNPSREAQGRCINLRNCKSVYIANSIIGPSVGEGIAIENCNNVVITNCVFYDNSGGVYALSCTNVKVNKNQFSNVHGPGPRGQFVQFDKVSGPGNEIKDNVGENFPGKSNAEDLVSIYMSSGTPKSPIHIVGNRFRGGGPSNSSGGILVGDNGGSYTLIENNILVNPGQYGIAIAGGNNHVVQNNTIYSGAKSFTNVGIYVWNQSASGCFNNAVLGNRVNYTNKSGIKNPYWNSKNCGSVNGEQSNDFNATITEAILPRNLLCKWPR